MFKFETLSLFTNFVQVLNFNINKMGQVLEENDKSKELKVEVQEVVTKDEEVSKEKAEELKKQDDAEKLIVLEVKTIKEIRVKVDGLAHIVKTVGTQSMEKINGHTKLLLVKSWYGEVLEYLGQPLTNPNELHKAQDIGGDSDISEPIKVQLKKVQEGKEPVLTDANDIESINHVRLDVERILNQTGILSSIKNTVYETFIYQSLKEAQFWMERELYRIKEVYKQELYKKTQQGKRSLPKRPQKQSPIITNKGGLVDAGGRKIDFNKGKK